MSAGTVQQAASFRTYWPDTSLSPVTVVQKKPSYLNGTFNISYRPVNKTTETVTLHLLHQMDETPCTQPSWEKAGTTNYNRPWAL